MENAHGIILKEVENVPFQYDIHFLKNLYDAQAYISISLKKGGGHIMGLLFSKGRKTVSISKGKLSEVNEINYIN